MPAYTLVAESPALSHGNLECFRGESLADLLADIERHKDCPPVTAEQVGHLDFIAGVVADRPQGYIRGYRYRLDRRDAAGNWFHLTLWT